MRNHSPLQRKRMWALLSNIAEKATFQGYKLDKDEWKRLLTAHLYGKERLTRHMTVSEMNDFHNYLEVFCIDNDITIKEYHA